MLQIGSSIVSIDIIEKHFVCDLAVCKGACCIQGVSGAPLEEDEIDILRKIFPKVKPHMTAAGIAAVEQQGVYYIDSDNDRVTPLVGDSGNCVFAFIENSICNCAIEKAFINGDIDFRKPISCHLYPISITKYKNFDAVNYHKWHVCNDALILGTKKGTPLYVFLKEPLIRKFGTEWYEQLCVYIEILRKSSIKTT